MCCCTSSAGSSFNNTLKKHLEKSPELEQLVRAKDHEQALQLLVKMKALSPEEAKRDHSKKMGTLKRMSRKLSSTQVSRRISGGGRGVASGGEEGGLSSPSRQELDELPHPKSAGGLCICVVFN